MAIGTSALSSIGMAGSKSVAAGGQGDISGETEEEKRRRLMAQQSKLGEVALDSITWGGGTAMGASQWGGAFGGALGRFGL
jgi:hypothetical protein